LKPEKDQNIQNNDVTSSVKQSTSLKVVRWITGFELGVTRDPD
jgi:hypothetical protein